MTLPLRHSAARVLANRTKRVWEARRRSGWPAFHLPGIINKSSRAVHGRQADECGRVAKK